MTTPAFIGEADRGEAEHVPRDEAIRGLHALGGQLVLCQKKIPIQDDWIGKYPSVEEALKRGPEGVGTVLGSVGLVGIDVDVKKQKGDKANSKVKRSVAQNLAVREILGPPLGTVTTPSGGSHLLYKGTGREGNVKFAYGDVRGAKGHVVLYDAAETLKAAELAQSDDVEPVDVEQLKTISHNSTPGEKKKTPAEPRHTPEGLEHLAEGRNNYLNEGVFLDARDGMLAPEREAAWCRAAVTSGLLRSDVDATIRSASEAGDKAKLPFSLSDTGNAQQFAQMNAETLRYDHGKEVWFHWRPHHWREARTGEADRQALETVLARQRAAVGNEAASKWATRSLSRSARDNMLRLARSEHPLAVAGDGWDPNPWLLGGRGGVIDLQTGVLRDGRAEDFITKVSPITFDAGADCPRWLQFLDEIFADNPELVAYMKRVAGYILTGITVEQCFFVLHGVGANGKTTFIETLRHVLGHDFCWSMPFPSASWSDNISEYQRAELVGRRLVVTSELSKQKELNAELVKSLTGSDRINARRVRERPFTFTPTAKFVLAVNDPPVIEDTSVGMWRRVKLIPFLQSFDTPDMTLGDALRAEAPGILTWAVEGCLEWQQDGLQHPECVTAATAEYRQESDPFHNFVTERCTTDGRGSVGATALFEAFSSWAPDTGMSQKAFGKRIRTLPNVTIQHRRTGVFYEGIAQLVDENTRYEM